MNNKRRKQEKSNQIKARFFAGVSCAAYLCAVVTAIVSSNLPGNSMWKDVLCCIVDIGFFAGVVMTFIWGIFKPIRYPFTNMKMDSMSQEELEEIGEMVDKIMAKL